MLGKTRTWQGGKRLQSLSFDNVARPLCKAEFGNDITRINNQSRILDQECIINAIMVGYYQSRIETT